MISLYFAKTNFFSELEQTKHENRRACEEAESRVRSEYGLKLSMSERRTQQLEGENHSLKVGWESNAKLKTKKFQLRINQAESDLEKRQLRRESSINKNDTIDVSKMERSEPIGAEQVEVIVVFFIDFDIMALKQILIFFNVNF